MAIDMDIYSSFSFLVFLNKIFGTYCVTIRGGDFFRSFEVTRRDILLISIQMVLFVLIGSFAVHAVFDYYSIYYAMELYPEIGTMGSYFVFMACVFVGQIYYKDSNIGLYYDLQKLARKLKRLGVITDYDRVKKYVVLFDVIQLFCVGVISVEFFLYWSIIEIYYIYCEFISFLVMTQNLIVSSVVYLWVKQFNDKFDEILSCRDSRVFKSRLCKLMNLHLEFFEVCKNINRVHKYVTARIVMMFFTVTYSAYKIVFNLEEEKIYYWIWLVDIINWSFCSLFVIFATVSAFVSTSLQVCSNLQ